MTKFAQDLGYRMVSRFLPTLTAAARPCTCEPGFTSCISLRLCTCQSDCRTVKCQPRGTCS